MSTTRVDRPPSRQVLAALGHLVWTTAIVIGGPLALAHFFGWPLPTQMPDWGAVATTPLQLVDPTVILNVFVCAAWVCWFVVAAYLALDFVDVARGVGARVHRIGPLGTVAGKLVGSAALLVSLARPTPALAAPLPTAAAVQVVDLPAPTPNPAPLPGLVAPWSVDPPRPPADPAAPSPGPVYVVQRGDSLWAIAETHLGSGFRWTEIHDLNRDLITDPDLIGTGWPLTLPHDAVGIALASPTPEPVIEPGPATPDAPAAAPAQHPAATETATAQPGTTVEPEAITASTATVAPTDAPTGAPDPTTAAPTAVEPSPAADSSPTTTTPVNHSREPADADVLPALVDHLPGITGATVLATALLLALRRHQRRPGGPLARHRPTEAEQTVIAAADVPLVRWVGQELALLGEQLAGRGFDANPVAVEFSEDTGIELLWDRPAPDAPAPWEAVPGAWAWRTLYDPDAPVPAPERPSLIAGLVTIGERDGRQLLVNLEAFGSLAVLGDPPAVDDFVRSIIVELASGDEIADAHVLATSRLAPSDLGDHLSRLTVVDADEAVAELTASTTTAAGLLDDIDAESTFAYRIYNKPVLPLEVTVAVTAPNADPSVASRLVEQAPPHRGVAAILTGDAAGIGATITIDPDGRARLEPLDVTFTPAALPPSSAAAAAELLGDTPSLPQPRHDGAEDRAPEPSTRSDRGSTGPRDDDTDEDAVPAPEEGTTRDESVDHRDEVIDLTDSETSLDSTPHVVLPEPRMLVKVLGTPRIVDGPPMGRRELAIAVYVACATRPVRHDHIQDAIWGGEAVSSKRVFNLIGAARTALGEWDGQPVLTRAVRPESTITVQDGVWTDLELLRRLVTAADRSASSGALALLQRALDLVEGPPFDADGYDWAYTNQLVSEAETLIERVSLLAADLALDAGEFDLARWAVQQGLRGLPGDEALYQARMRIESAAGNPAAVRRAYAELVSYLKEFDTEPSPEATNLYEFLAPVTRRTT